jgi:hypothetical protein
MGPHHILAESANYRVYSEFETVFLERPGGPAVVIGDFYGDPECAIIDRQERWCIVAGCGLILYRFQKPFREYDCSTVCNQWTELFRERSDVWWISSVTQINDDVVALELSPNEKHAGTWELNVTDMSVRRV